MLLFLYIMLPALTVMFLFGATVKIYRKIELKDLFFEYFKRKIRIWKNSKYLFLAEILMNIFMAPSLVTTTFLYVIFRLIRAHFKAKKLKRENR